MHYQDSVQSSENPANKQFKNIWKTSFNTSTFSHCYVLYLVSNTVHLVRLVLSVCLPASSLLEVPLTTEHEAIHTLLTKAQLYVWLVSLLDSMCLASHFHSGSRSTSFSTQDFFPSVSMLILSCCVNVSTWNYFFFNHLQYAHFEYISEASAIMSLPSVL